MGLRLLLGWGSFGEILEGCRGSGSGEAGLLKVILLKSF